MKKLILIVALLSTISSYSQTSAELIAKADKQFHEQGDGKGALANYNKAIELNPKNSEAYYKRGLLKEALIDEKGAVEDFTKAIALDPKNIEAYLNRGIIKHGKQKSSSFC